MIQKTKVVSSLTCLTPHLEGVEQLLASWPSLFLHITSPCDQLELPQSMAFSEYSYFLYISYIEKHFEKPRCKLKNILWFRLEVKYIIGQKQVTSLAKFQVRRITHCIDTGKHSSSIGPYWETSYFKNIQGKMSLLLIIIIFLWC